MGCCMKSNSVREIVPNRRSKRGLSGGTFIALRRGRLPEDYTILSHLGSGAFAEVKLCAHAPTGQKRAVKFIYKAGLHKSQLDAELFLNEIKVVRELDHPNILRCFEIYEDSRRFYVATEFCGGGELFDQILERRRFTESDAALVMKQLLSAVAYCHAHNVIHRDLKPENILLEDKDSLNIKVADFGSSVMIESKKTLSDCFGTPFYIAPEILTGEYNEKCDEWSCGVIMYVLLTGKEPYSGTNQKEILQMVKENPLKVGSLPHVTNEAKKLLKKLLEVNTNKRISAAEALEHPWFSIFPEEGNTENLEELLPRLRSFQASCKLKEAIEVYLSTHIISSGDLKILQQAFQVMDKNDDGALSKEELIDAYKELVSNEEAIKTAEEIMSQVDVDNNGVIQYSEFLMACADHTKLISKQNLESAFRVFDKDASGKISLAELHKVLEGHFSDEEIGKMMKELDTNLDGEIDLKEFLSIMN